VSLKRGTKMSKLIIGIHGLANKPERVVLETYTRLI